MLDVRSGVVLSVGWEESCSVKCFMPGEGWYKVLDVRRGVLLSVSCEERCSVKCWMLLEV